MQKVMEPLFEIVYLLAGLVISAIILAKSNKRPQFVVFGVMGLLLVFGDAFHLVPRMLNAWQVGGENIVAYLGIGKLVTSITMTVFYLLLFWFFKLRYGKKTPIALDVTLYVLAAVRIILVRFAYERVDECGRSVSLGNMAQHSVLCTRCCYGGAHLPLGKREWRQEIFTCLACNHTEFCILCRHGRRNKICDSAWYDDDSKDSLLCMATLYGVGRRLSR